MWRQQSFYSTQQSIQQSSIKMQNDIVLSSPALHSLFNTLEYLKADQEWQCGMQFARTLNNIVCDWWAVNMHGVQHGKNPKRNPPLPRLRKPKLEHNFITIERPPDLRLGESRLDKHQRYFDAVDDSESEPIDDIPSRADSRQWSPSMMGMPLAEHSRNARANALQLAEVNYQGQPKNIRFANIREQQQPLGEDDDRLPIQRDASQESPLKPKVNARDMFIIDASRFVSRM